jgi:hypothetical protein
MLNFYTHYELALRNKRNESLPVKLQSVSTHFSVKAPVLIHDLIIHNIALAQSALTESRPVEKSGSSCPYRCTITPETS